MQKIITNIKSKLSKDIHLEELLKGSVIAFIFKIVGMGLGYIFVLLIARWYGADTMGLYALSFTLLNIFVTIGVFGFDNALVKFIADYNRNNKVFLIKEVYQKALIVTSLVSCIVSILFFLHVDFFAVTLFKNEQLIFFFQIISFAIIPYTLLKINTATFRGLKRIKEFSFMETVLVFLLSVVLFIILYFLYKNQEITILSQVVAIFISSIISFILIKKHISKGVITKKVLKYKNILKISFPMLLASSIALIMSWTDIIMLGVFKSASEVGVYTVLIKLAGLTSITLMAINSIAAPKFSELYSNNDIDGLKKIVQHSSKMIFYSSLPIILILSIFPKFILEIFGQEFIMGTTALWILMFGQFVNIISGSGGYIMQMTNNHNVFQKIIIVTFLINIILNYFLIPMFGINGAAFASMFSIIFWNIFTVVYLKKTMGINTIYIPKIFQKNGVGK